MIKERVLEILFYIGLGFLGFLILGSLAGAITLACYKLVDYLSIVCSMFVSSVGVFVTAISLKLSLKDNANKLSFALNKIKSTFKLESIEIKKYMELHDEVSHKNVSALPNARGTFSKSKMVMKLHFTADNFSEINTVFLKELAIAVCAHIPTHGLLLHIDEKRKKFVDLHRVSDVEFVYTVIVDVTKKFFNAMVNRVCSGKHGCQLKVTKFCMKLNHVSNAKTLVTFKNKYYTYEMDNNGTLIFK